MFRKIFIFLSDIHIDLILIVVLLLTLVIQFEQTKFQIVGLVITLSSLILWILARIQLGKSFSFWPEAKVLVKRGLYSKIRHPIYIFSTLAFLGVAIRFNKFYLYLLWILILAVEVVRARKEEWVLTEKFGHAYLEYKKQTWF